MTAGGTIWFLHDDQSISTLAALAFLLSSSTSSGEMASPPFSDMGNSVYCPELTGGATRSVYRWSRRVATVWYKRWSVVRVMGYLRDPASVLQLACLHLATTSSSQCTLPRAVHAVSMHSVSNPRRPIDSREMGTADEQLATVGNAGQLEPGRAAGTETDLKRMTAVESAIQRRTMAHGGSGLDGRADAGLFA